jgi:sugar phosphate isomerase/epimerase
MTEGWGQGDRATNAAFQPLETFTVRFEQLLLDVRALGFRAIDLWTAHLNWSWATDAHIATARDLLAREGLPVASLAGGFGATRQEFAAACRLAEALQAPALGGSTPLLFSEREFVIDTLKKHGVRLAIENHPEKTPGEMLAKIGDGGDGTIGTAVDTGWYGTHGYDAARAIEELGEHVFHVHLKDVLAPGAHDTCRYGQGCVPIEACVQVLKASGYAGYYSVEHEPEHFDPSEDCRASLLMLRHWLQA